jgi:hypothetical protein
MSTVGLASSQLKELEVRIGSVVTVLKHYGEAGRNIEDIVRMAIRDYVPQKFGIETGFVRSLDDANWQSNQIHLLFTRQDIGHPLAVFPGTKIFPIESVIGFMEVTKSIDSEKLALDFRKISELKHRVKRRYTIPTNVAREMGVLPKVENQTEKDLLNDRITRVRIESADLEPRFFYFAFSTSWKKLETICRNLALIGKKEKVHLHGMLILNTGYFKHTPTNDPQKAYRISYINRFPAAYIAFIHDLVDSLQTFTIVPETAAVPLSDYHLIDARYSIWSQG